jgi:hypothetical protein
VLIESGHDVTGLDTEFFAGCNFNDNIAKVPAMTHDLRDITVEDVKVRCRNSSRSSLK